MARSDRIQSVITPVLDVMQTIPSFVYLIPVVMLLGIGKVPGLLAVCIYAIPPIVRLTNLGIRLVDADVMEAATAFGANYKQRLWGVQVPLALPNIFAGVNQTIMMALAMVVIASMIGVKGLGVPCFVRISNQYLALGLMNVGHRRLSDYFRPRVTTIWCVCIAPRRGPRCLILKYQLRACIKSLVQTQHQFWNTPKGYVKG